MSDRQLARTGSTSRIFGWQLALAASSRGEEKPRRDSPSQTENDVNFDKKRACDSSSQQASAEEPRAARALQRMSCINAASRHGLHRFATRFRAPQSCSDRQDLLGLRRKSLIRSRNIRMPIGIPVKQLWQQNAFTNVAFGEKVWILGTHLCGRVLRTHGFYRLQSHDHA